MPFQITGVIGPIRLGSVDYIELQARPGRDNLYHAIGFLSRRAGADYREVADLRDAVATDLHFSSRMLFRMNVVRGFIVSHRERPSPSDDPMSDKWDELVENYIAFTRDGTFAPDLLTVSTLAHLFTNAIELYDPAGTLVPAPADGVIVPTDADRRHRLIVRRVRGRHANGLQFNPVVPAATFNLEKELPPVAEPAARRSLAWLGAPELRPYVPPVAFSDYQHGLAPPPPPSGMLQRISVALSSSNVVDAVRPRITAVILENAFRDLKCWSSSFTWADVSASVHVAVRPPFSLPLVAGPAPMRYAPFPDLSMSSVQIGIDRPDLVTNVRFRVVSYAAPSAPAAVASERSIPIGTLGEPIGSSGTERLYQVPLVAVLDPRAVKALYWANGPYLLLAAVGGDNQVERAAFTHFSVPSPWDVATIENIGRSRGLLLGDDMAPLTAATVRRRTNDTMRRFSPSGGVLTERLKVDETVSRSRGGSASVTELSHLLSKHGKSYDPNTVNVLYQREDGMYFAVTSWASVIVCRKVDEVWYAHSVYTTGDKRWFGVLDKPSSGDDPATRVFTQLKPHERWTVRTDVGGSADAETDWDCYYLSLDKKQYPVALAHTAGISSCAGGVTFDTKGEWMILWHIDAGPASPVKRIVQMLWPKASDCTGLRTMALVFPSAWEVNKYRMANMCPPEMHAASRDLFLLRGAHLYSDKVVSNCGADVFGVEFGRAPALVGTYDISQRSLRLRKALLGPAQLSATHIDLADEVYGSYRTGKHVVNSNETLATYFAGIDKRSPESLAETLDASGCFEIPDLIGTAFDTVDALCHPFLDIEKMLVGERAELEISGSDSEQWDQRAASASAPVSAWYDNQSAIMLAMQAEIEADIEARAALERAYTLVGVSGDGNCLFRAFGVAYERLLADTANPTTYRVAAADHMRDAAGVFSYDRLGIDGSGHVSRDAYIDTMRVPAAPEMTAEERRRHWGGGPELAALARSYAVRIYVHRLQGAPTPIEDTSEARYRPTRDIHLYFQGGNHYEAMFPRPVVPIAPTPVSSE